jgi:hypothetical protein
MNAEPERHLLPRAKKFPLHFRIYGGVLIFVLFLNLILGAGLPLFWPLAAWAVGLAVHYFIASAIDVNEEWVQEKAMDLRYRSYDFDHIENIQGRVKKRDDSVTHHEERD